MRISIRIYFIFLVFLILSIVSALNPASVFYTRALANTATNVTWTNAVGVSVAGNSLTKTNSTGWGNAGASSVQSILSGDGHVEFAASETNNYRMGGLSNGDIDQRPNDIDFAISLWGDGSIHIFEKGAGQNGNTSFGNYAAGDIFKISVEAGIVKYYKNWSLLYTSTASPIYPLSFDTSLYDLGSTITNATISSVVPLSTSPPPSPTPTPAPDTQAPTAPTNLMVTSVGLFNINLFWTASTDNVGVEGYKIFRNNIQIGDAYTNTAFPTSYSDTIVSPSTTYSYTVSAFDTTGNNSAQSNTVTATTQSFSTFTSAPVIDSFFHNNSNGINAQITSGQSTSLIFKVTGAPFPKISINNGVGTVTGSSVTVSPTVTTTYILTATNSVGTVTFSLTVTVSLPTGLNPLPIAMKVFNGHGRPRISGTNVVASGLDVNGPIGEHILLYDLVKNQVRNLTVSLTEPMNRYQSDIHGNRVVWFNASSPGDLTADRLNIFTVNLSTNQLEQVSSGPADDEVPVVSNNYIVWTVLGPTNTGLKELKAYDLATKITVTVSSEISGLRAYAISGDWLVWLRNDRNLIATNLRTSEQRVIRQVGTPESFFNQFFDRIDADGNKFVWSDAGISKGNNVFLYDLATAQVEQLPITGDDVRISGKYIAYTANGIAFLFNLETKTPQPIAVGLTVEDIDGNRVLLRGETSVDLFIFKISETTTIPTQTPEMLVATPSMPVPTIPFTKNLGFGLRNNLQVKILQQVLIKENLFPADLVTGNFLVRTMNAVKAFQLRHGITPTGFVGPLTRAELNKNR